MRWPMQLVTLIVYSAAFIYSVALWRRHDLSHGFLALVSPWLFHIAFFYGVVMWRVVSLRGDLPPSQFMTWWSGVTKLHGGLALLILGVRRDKIL